MISVEIPEREVNQDIIKLLDETKDSGQVVRVDRDEKPPLYIVYLYPRKYSDDGDHVYFVTSTNHLVGKYASKMAVHDSLVDMSGATVELIDVDEVEEDCRKAVAGYQDRGHPFDEVHVFVKSVDDGRYKDDFRFVREDKEYRFEGYDTALEKWRDHDDYIEIGTFVEVREMDGDEYSFDFKQGGRGVPTDLSALADGHPSEIVRQKLGDSNE